jgi:hypothetical protein
VRIGWVNDYGIDGLGGSLLTQVAAASASRHEIVWCLPDALDTSCDLYVVNNHNLFDDEQLMFLAGTRPIYWSHDVSPSGKQVRSGALHSLVRQSRRVIFLSPLHRDVFLSVYGLQDIGARRAKLVPALVNPFDFDDIEWTGDQDALWVGTFERHRGMREAMEWAETEGVVLHMYGYRKPPDYLLLSGHVQLCGQIDYRRISEIMARYRRLVTFPLEVDRVGGKPAYCEACGRVAIEAKLAGLEVIHNGRLGAASWPWFRSQSATRSAMVAGPEQFWDIVEGSL